QILKLRETNPNYEYKKTVNDFVSDPEVYEAIIENWQEEYGKNIKDSLEKNNSFSEIRISDNVKTFVLLFIQKNEKEYHYISINLLFLKIFKKINNNFKKKINIKKC